MFGHLPPCSFVFGNCRPWNRAVRRWWVLLPLLLLAPGCSHKAKVQQPQVARTGTPARTTPPPTPSKPSPPATQPVAHTGEVSPVPPPQPVTRPAVGKLAPLTLPDSPAIRIGLATAAHEVRISSSGEYYLLEKVAEATRRLVRGEIKVRVERGAQDPVPGYRIQVASFSKQEMAEEFRKNLAEKVSAPVEVHENREIARYQVRVGEFKSREEAQKFAIDLLRPAGFRDFLIVKGEVPDKKGEQTLALRGANNLFLLNKAGFVFFPASTTTMLTVDNKPYRGFLEVNFNSSGLITVVNQLGIEEYLLGVIPAEISPDSYPESAALAAQAIAARTYALKNTGRFRSEGFDLTADIRSQVYLGFSGEKDATDEAVRQTFGMAIYYQDQLINAMYSSTCGGRTEDYSNVFDGPPVPYLKGVVCEAEASLDREVKLDLKGTHDLVQPFYSDEGIVANRGIELAQSLGIGESLTPAYLAGSPTKNELVRWIGQAMHIAGRATETVRGTGDLGTRAAFIRLAAESLFGPREIEQRISASDADYYLANLKDGDAVPNSARKALAYLLQQGLWRADPENRARPNDPIRRADALLLLARWIESIQPQILRTGVFVSRISGDGSDAADDNPLTVISVKSGNRIQSFTLSRNLRLFLMAKGSGIPADSLKMIGNEKLSFHLAEDGRIDFLEVELNPTGAASDRYSPAATWNVTMTSAKLAEKLRPLAGGLGEFRDLRPWKLGTSGRVVQIQVIGSRRSAVLNGFKVRTALGLRDTLFTISRTLGADGSVESFTFHGRGWGHGVGLCQVGAFGMARAGKSYEQILKTYYQGVEIRNAY